MTDLSDLSKIYDRQDEGADLDILHPVTQKPIGLTVKVLGYQGVKMRACQNEVTNERIRNPKRFRSAEALERQAQEQIAAAVAGWTWADGVTLNGERPEATPENVLGLMKTLPFVADQIDSFAANMANFSD
ncbi:hypothetical protein [Antarcticirhabdus aurantiaca]|uniref:Uncharacterized protein n=1 Tax=Antarcticirhabdus aurantiaca TaxID=2606717 RepID=A0ACD4NWW4_9HYPH|nr:hypothetical protein [Antarcticirhabdus aurantiaca]WAJ31151.1 hypothetical protein OXU80_13510 [Jeongeuplla avenae]